MLKLYKELKRRKVLKTLGVYAAAALIIIQVSDIVFPQLLFPEWTVRFIIILVILGFPVTFFLSWTYDLKHDTGAVDKSEHTDVGLDKKSKKLLFPITGFLTIVGVAFWSWYSLGSLSHGSEINNKIFKSIAVLYLDNQSNDQKDDKICAGLTTSITTAFSRLGRFKVKARTDVLKFRNKITSHKEIRDILGVDAFIEGSLIKIPNNNKYIANIALIDAEKGNNIWAKQYTKTAEEISNISNSIASEVAQFLSGDEIKDFEVLNDVPNMAGNDISFSLMGEGINLLDSKEYDKSIHVFDSILVNEPNNNRAIYSKGRALEGLGQYSDAINSYNQILTSVRPVPRTKNVWSHPDILKHGVTKIDVLDELKIANELNIQIIAVYKKDQKISEIYALDLNTHKIIWERTYHFSVSIEIIGNNLVVAHQAFVGGRDNEAAIYIHSLKHGTLLYSKEFAKEYPEQKVLIDVLKNNGVDVPSFQDAVFLYVRRDDNYHSLVMIDPQSKQMMLEKIIPVPGVVEGNPLIYLVEEGGSEYVFHRKGLNLYLFEIKSGKLVWNKALPDDTYDIVVDNNVMLLYSTGETDVVLQNIVSQKTIGDYTLNSPIVDGHSLKENIILRTKNSITSLKTYKPFMRGLHNWTRNIDENEDVSRWEFFYIHDNVFVVTESGNLYCINRETGKIINKNSMGHKVDFWGYPEYNSDGSSPKSLIMYAGDFLMGLDPHNGKTLWKIRELNIVKEDEQDWRIWGRIVPLGNKVVVLKKHDDNNYLIIKTYNRMTGELLWISEEEIFQGLTKSKYAGNLIINNEFWGYSNNNTLYLGLSPEGSIYNVDISWRPNKNYVSKANLYKSLAYCYNKIDNQKMASEFLEDIIDVVDQQNEGAFQQLSNIYLSNGDNINYIKNQVGFHELVFYDDIKRGNIENQLMQTSGLKWVQHFTRDHDFAVYFPDENIIVAGLCIDGGGCSLKYFRSGSGILIGESDLDLKGCTNVVALNNRLVFVGEQEKPDGGQASMLFEVNPINRAVNKVSLWDGSSYTKKIYYFEGLYFVDSDNSNPDHTVGRERSLVAVDMVNGSVLWKNNYDYNLLWRIKNIGLVNKDSLILVPLAEEIRAVNVFSGSVEWVYEYDDFDGIKYIDQQSLKENELSFITSDNEFVSFNVINQKLLLLSEEIDYDDILNIAFVDNNRVLAYTYDGNLLLYNYNGDKMVLLWEEDFKQPISILGVINNLVYIQSLDGATITILNIEGAKNKHTVPLIWNAEKIFFDTGSFGIFNKKSVYFING